MYLLVLAVSALIQGIAVQASSQHVEDTFTRVKPSILGPAIADKPLAVIWNVNSSTCSEFGVDLDDLLDKFGFVHNSGPEIEKSDKILLLYEKHFRYLPHYAKNDTPINGGLPINGNLSGLLEVFNGILEKTSADFRGLSVIDWESWRALFNRMNSSLFAIYRKESIKLVKQYFPNWTESQQLEFAKFEYQRSARKYMQTVLELGKIIRPGGLWGFYLYPDCRYYNLTTNDYLCSKEERERNDEIQWLFDSSTALFPSMYLHENVHDKPYAAKYVANRIREAVRVDGNRPGHTSIPIFSYHMITYPREDDFIDLYDLKNSIGVASLLGGSGVVIWGNYGNSATAEKCKILKSYLETTLGPYCKMVTVAALKCSKKLCDGNGRCVVVIPDRNLGERYLTSGEVAEMLRDFVGDPHEFFDALSSADAENGRPHLKCQCYKGWWGRHCDRQWPI